jgi:hypothetical protein
MIEEGRFKTDRPTPGSFLARREGLEHKHGCVFKMLGSKGMPKTVVRWVDPESGKRYVTEAALPSSLIPRLEDLFAGTVADASWYREETGAQE